MEITTHGLKKPGGDDFYNIQDHNDNTDIIEQHLSDTDIHVNSQEIAQITEVETLAQIDEYDTNFSVWGKVKKVISTLIEHISSVATSASLGHIKIGTGLIMSGGTASVKLTDDLAMDDSTTALSAKAGKLINDSLTSTKENIYSTYFNGILIAFKNKTTKAIRIAQPLKTTLSADTNYNICTLSSGFRPEIEELAKTLYVDGALNYKAVLNISATGIVTIKPLANIPSGTWFAVYETFI